MKLTFLTLIFSPLILLAIELNITPSKEYSVNSNEINFLVYQASKQRIKVSNKQAKNIIEKNRILADEYLKNSESMKKELAEIKLNIEKELSSKMMKKILEQNEIEENVLKSYYYDKKERFEIGESLEIDFYKCDTFDVALHVYKLLKNKQDVSQYLNKQNITKDSGVYRRNRLDKQIKNFLSESSEIMIVPPLFFFDHFTVSDVKKIYTEYTRTYEEAKPIIKNILYKAVYSRIKENYIKEISKK